MENASGSPRGSLVRPLHFWGRMSIWRTGFLILLTGCMGQIDSGQGGPGGMDDPGAQPDAGITTPPTPDAPPPLTAKQVMEQWSGCMTLADFQTANMTEAWSELAASNNQLCRNCHGDGGFSFITSPDENLFFTTISEHSFYLVKFFSVQGPDVVINTGSFQNAATTLASHPRFNASENAGMIALKTFYDATLARKTAGTCDPSRLKD